MLVRLGQANVDVERVDEMDPHLLGTLIEGILLENKNGEERKEFLKNVDEAAAHLAGTTTAQLIAAGRFEGRSLKELRDLELEGITNPTRINEIQAKYAQLAREAKRKRREAGAQ